MPLDLQTFTLFHVLLSLAGIISGLVAAGGRRLGGWATVFLVTTAATNGVAADSGIRSPSR